MGIWEWMGSTAKSVKENAPDAWTPIKNGCQATYGYGSAAVKGVTANAGQWVPDRSNLTLYTTKFAKHAGLYAVKEGYKIIPAGSAFYKILSDTMNDVKHEKRIDQRLKVLEEKLQAADHRSNAESGVKPAPSDTSYAECIGSKTETPQDVIRVFMAKEFIGNQLLCDLMVTNIRKKGNKPE